MVNGAGEAVYCKFHYKSDQGIQTFTRQQADEMAKSDPDYDIREPDNNFITMISSISGTSTMPSPPGTSPLGPCSSRS